MTRLGILGLALGLLALASGCCCWAPCGAGGCGTGACAPGGGYGYAAPAAYNYPAYGGSCGTCAY